MYIYIYFIQFIRILKPQKLHLPRPGFMVLEGLFGLQEIAHQPAARGSGGFPFHSFPLEKWVDQLRESIST